MSHRIRCCDRAIIPLTVATDDRHFAARTLGAIDGIARLLLQIENSPTRDRVGAL
ncbi:MAG: hypothetical protein MUE44_09370 [Oscillatoriaceae cyanobacterium Prado104]|nr:hypothetical protein [Oscillatoriaceae cyanobacterium Prado104]